MRKDGVQGRGKPLKTGMADGGRRGLAVLLGVAGILIVGALLLAFEVHPKTIVHGMSREVRENPYYALERWLEAEGIAVRALEGASAWEVMEAQEAMVIVCAEGLDWTPDAPEGMKAWLSEEGGSLLFFFHESPTKKGEYYGWMKKEFLDAMAVEFKTQKDSSRATGEEEPSLDRSILFRDAEKGDEGPWTELLEKEIGRGRLVVSGYPWFLSNRELEGPANADLAWSLTGASPEAESGILLVLPAAESSGGIAGILARGWWPALLLPLGLLLGIFLWSSLGSFGPLSAGEEERGPGIGERLRAEARFLARWRALEPYLGEYRDAIAFRMRSRGEIWDAAEDPSLERLVELTGLDRRVLQEALDPSGPGAKRMTKKDFFERMKTLETILERL